MMNEGKELLKFHGWVWFGVPAVLGWLGYGIAWLLAPRFADFPDPLQCAWMLAGGWYAIAGFCVVMWAFSAR